MSVKLTRTVSKTLSLLTKERLTRSEIIRTVDGLLDALRPVATYWSQIQNGAPFCQAEAKRLAEPFVTVAKESARAWAGPLRQSLIEQQFEPDYPERRVEGLMVGLCPTMHMSSETATRQAHQFVRFLHRLIKDESETGTCKECGDPVPGATEIADKGRVGYCGFCDEVVAVN
jgi:hypothetical protein